jgi:hypothetical protein
MKLQSFLCFFFEPAVPPAATSMLKLAGDIILFNPVTNVLRSMINAIMLTFVVDPQKHSIKLNDSDVLHQNFGPSLRYLPALVIIFFFFFFFIGHTCNLIDCARAMRERNSFERSLQSEKSLFCS